jgi:hypothetical protein
MKRVLFSVIFLISVFAKAHGQQDLPKNKFKLFSRAEISYLFGINDVYDAQKVNSLHVKFVIGSANQITGFGIGLENSSYRAANGDGLSFETLNFSANAHILAKPVTTTEINYFIKAAAGYAPRIFRNYSRGFNYEVSPGILFTTKRKSKYFLQAIYQYQEIENFFLADGQPKIKAIGLGIGTWF